MLCYHVAMPSSRGSSQPRHQTQVSRVADGFFTSRATREAPVWHSKCSISIQFILVTQLCLTLCYRMDGSTPGFPVHHQLLELAQTHVHQVGDAIQSSHPLSSSSPPALHLSQYQGLFQ